MAQITGGSPGKSKSLIDQVLEWFWNTFALIFAAFLTIILLISLLSRLVLSGGSIFEWLLLPPGATAPEYMALIEASMFTMIFVAVGLVAKSRQTTREFNSRLIGLRNELRTLLPLDDVNEVYPNIRRQVERVNKKYGSKNHPEKVISVLALSGRTNAINFIPWAEEGLLNNWRIKIVVPSDTALAYDYIPSEWKPDRDMALMKFQESAAFSQAKGPNLEVIMSEHVPFVHGFRVGQSSPIYWVSFLRWRADENKFRSDPEDPYEEVGLTGDRKASDIKRDLFDSWWRKVAIRP